MDQLMMKEQKNETFDFLRKNHILFTYFTKLVEQYSKVRRHGGQNLNTEIKLCNWCSNLTLKPIFMTDSPPTARSDGEADWRH